MEEEAKRKMIMKRRRSARGMKSEETGGEGTSGK
jgi:hypothetical protein